MYIHHNYQISMVILATVVAAAASTMPPPLPSLSPSQPTFHPMSTTTHQGNVVTISSSLSTTTISSTSHSTTTIISSSHSSTTTSSLYQSNMVPTSSTGMTKMDSSTSMSPTPPPEPVRCPEQRDKEFRIKWPKTKPKSTRRLPCPPTFIGYVTRHCNGRGDWRKPIFTGCIASSIDDIQNISSTFFDSGSLEANEEDAMYFIRQLRNLSQPPPRTKCQSFLSRSELRTIKKVARNSFNLFRMGNTTTEDVLDVFGLFSNALDSRNRDSWEELQESESGSEELLSNAEEYARLATTLLQRPGDTVRYSEDNIALRVGQIIINETTTDALFPSENDLTNTSIDSLSNNIRIPLGYIHAMADEGPSNKHVANTAFMLFPTLQDFLPNSNNELNENVSIASVIISAQVLSSNDSTDFVDVSVLDRDPVELTFSINVSAADFESGFKATCVYWNFSSDFNSTSSGTWLSDGIVTEIIDNNTVRCLSSHLTSFAVLVDVTGLYLEETNETTTTLERTALSYVSYIGTGLSVVCLTATTIFLLLLGKEMFIKLHYFIHLNLSIALLLGLIVFIGGINYASTYDISCKIVALLLHYFFLSAFCWMLCEAILLYLLVVVVFTKLTKRWYLYLGIGWGLPLIIVIPTFGAAFDGYVGELCWLSYSNHVIWTFIAPMCVIISINIIILIIISVQLGRIKYKIIKYKVNKATKYGMKDQLHRNTETAMVLFKGIIFLLPLLGITWFIGILALNENTTFFAWLFTILNSLQGVFIFLFHVVFCKEGLQKLGICKAKSPTFVSATDRTNLNADIRRKSIDSVDQI